MKQLLDFVRRLRSLGAAARSRDGAPPDTQRLLRKAGALARENPKKAKSLFRELDTGGKGLDLRKVNSFLRSVGVGLDRRVCEYSIAIFDLI